VLPESPKRTKPTARTPGGRLRKHEEQVIAFLKSRLEAKKSSALQSA
jgi:hypothetical protein